MSDRDSPTAGAFATISWTESLAACCRGFFAVGVSGRSELACTGGHDDCRIRCPPRADAIELVSGIAYRPDVRFQDGELRFVLAPPAGQFAGVAFRMASAAGYEILYFRSSPDCGCWIDMQYQPVFQGETTWQLYNDSTYTAAVPPSHRRGDLPVRIVLAGPRADIYLGGDKRPVLSLLTIPPLRRSAAH